MLQVTEDAAAAFKLIADHAQMESETFRVERSPGHGEPRRAVPGSEVGEPPHHASGRDQDGAGLTHPANLAGSAGHGRVRR